MTERRIEKLKILISESRARLLDHNPSFALLLMYLRFVAVPDMKKVSTDGITVFFNPQFIEKLTKTELDYVLCHQIMHIVFGHLETSSSLGSDLEDFHFACDIYINDNLSRAGFPVERYSHLGEMSCQIPWKKEFIVTDKTEVEIYEALPISLSYFDDRTRNRYLVDNHDFWHSRYALTEKDTVIIDFPKLDSTTELEVKYEDERDKGKDGMPQDGNYANAAGNDLKAFVYSALKATQGSNGKGDNHHVLSRALGRRKKSSLDWRKLLIEFLQEEVNDYSFSPPDRRYDDCPFFLPDFNEKDYLVKEILFMVDTSGSVSENELTAAYNEMCGVVEQFNGKISGKIGFFDDEVYPAVDFQSVKDILDIAPMGGGGTSFGIIFDYVKNEFKAQKPNCIIIFTDGQAEFPDEIEAMGIPVFWIINNYDITPPWGRIARISI